jgi:hypothetical protein
MSVIEDNIRRILEDLRTKSKRGALKSKYIIPIKKIEAWLNMDPRDRPELPDVDFETLGYSTDSLLDISEEPSSISEHAEVVSAGVTADRDGSEMDEGVIDQAFSSNDEDRLNDLRQNNMTDEAVDSPARDDPQSLPLEPLDLRDSLPDEKRVDREEEARLLINKSLARLRQDDFSSARDFLKQALIIAPWFEEGKEAQYRVDQHERKYKLSQVKRKLQNEQDIQALEQTLTEAEALIDLLDEEEDRTDLGDLINQAKNRFDEKRSLQGQITSLEALVSVIDNVNAVIQVNQAIERNERTWYSVRKGDTIPIYDALADITSNLNEKALSTVDRFRTRASMYMPETGFRYPHAALRYLDQNLGLEVLHEESLVPEELHENYSQDIDECINDLKENLQKIGINRQDLQLVDLINELRGNEQSVNINTFLKKANEKNLNLSDDFYARMGQDINQGVDRVIDFKSGGIKDIANLFSTQEEKIQKIVRVLEKWFEEINRLARKWTGRFVVAHLDAKSRTELRSLVLDWEKQKEEWESAQAHINILQSTPHPIDQIKILDQIREAYPHHADLPKVEINVLRVAPPYLKDLTESEIDKYLRNLPKEENQACDQHLPKSTVTKVEDIPVFSEIQQGLDSLRSSIAVFQEECQNIEQFTSDQKETIQKHLDRYYHSDIEAHNLQLLVKDVIENIQTIIKIPSVTAEAKTFIRSLCADVSMHFSSLLYKDGSSVKVDNDKLGHIYTELNAFDDYLQSQEIEQEIHKIGVPSWVVFDLRPYLDKLVMLQSIIENNAKDIEQFIELLDIIEESRKDVVEIVDKRIKPFKVEFVDKIEWRRRMRKIFGEIEDILQEKDVDTAYQNYKELEDEIKVDQEIQFLYEYRISPSLSDEIWYGQAKFYYKEKRWEACINETEKIKEQSVFFKDAESLRIKSKMHVSAELIKKYWSLKNYINTKEEFAFLESCMEKSEEFHVYYKEHLEQQNDLSNRKNELSERLDVDREFDVDNRIKKVEASLPGLKSRGDIDLIANNYQNVRIVSGAISELYDLKALKTSRVYELVEMFEWLGKVTGTQYQQYLTEKENRPISEEVLQLVDVLYDLQTKYRLYANSESRRLCRSIYKQYLLNEDTSLLSLQTNQTLTQMIMHWEDYAAKFLDDYETGELLNERRKAALYGFVDLALNDLDYDLALNILEKRHNPVNRELPDQPCVIDLQDIPFRFSFYDSPELKNRRDSAVIMRQADSFFDNSDYLRLAEYLKTSVEKYQRPELERKKDELFGEMIKGLAEAAQNTADIFEKASAYSLINNLTDDGPEFDLASLFFVDNSDQLQIKLKQLESDISGLRVDGTQTIERQLFRVEELEKLTRSLLPAAAIINNGSGKLKNGLRSVLDYKDKFEKIQNELERFSTSGRGWLECLETGNWGLIDEVLNKFDMWEFPPDHPEYLELKNRRDLHKKRRDTVERGKRDLMTAFAGEQFEEALSNCENIDKVLRLNDSDHNPPVDIYWIITPEFSVFHEFSQEEIYFFGQTGDNLPLRKRLESFIENYNGWYSFDQMISEMINYKSIGQIQSLAEGSGDWRKTIMEDIDAAITNLDDVFVLFKDVPNLKLRVQFEYPLEKKSNQMIVDQGKLNEPNNFRSKEIEKKLKEELRKLEDNYTNVQIRYQQFLEYEKNLYHKMNLVIQEIQNGFYVEAKEKLDQARHYFSNSDQKDIQAFLLHLKELVEG